MKVPQFGGGPPALELGSFHEENLSAESAPPQKGARFPCADAYPRRAQCPCASSSSRTEAPDPVGVMGTRGEQGFPRAERLLKRGDFEEAYSAGRREECGFFVLVALDRSAGPSRLGISVSRKVGNAVARNRCKRLIREVFRRNSARLPTGWDLVVVVRRSLVDSGYAEIEQQLVAAICRVSGRRSQ